MDENNSFLSSYKKNMEITNIQADTEVKEANTPAVHRYEEKSTFVKPKKKDLGPPPMSPKPKFLVPVIIGAVILVIVVIALLLLLNQGIKADDFTGWPENDVSLWASQNGVLLQVEKVFNDDVEEGKVISQNIKKGENIKKGGFIQITVSKGHDLSVLLPLPDIMSMTKEEIEKWAADNFMAKVRITGESSDTVALGKVIKYEINDASVVDKVSRNTPIYVIVSKGAVDEAAIAVTIPNFKEKSLAECYTFANENGLVLTVQEQNDDYVPKGTIISQSVKANEKVKKGTEIKLVISKGKLVSIPDFSDYTKEEATAVAGQLQIPVTVTEKYSGSRTGAFISQSIEAGAEYEEGNIVELKYSLGNQVALTSYVGQTRDAIESWAKELNDKGAGIKIKVTSTKSNAAKGSIIYQDPVNTMIPVKKTINITVSLGKVVFVPDFVIEGSNSYNTAITREEALAMCEELKIIPVFVKENNGGVLPGTVWSQDKPAGAEVAEGSKITLKYSPSIAYAVPAFRGMTKAQAEVYLSQFTVTFVNAEQNDGSLGADLVTEQSLTAGSTVPAGTAITLKVNPPPAAP